MGNTKISWKLNQEVMDLYIRELTTQGRIKGRSSLDEIRRSQLALDLYWDQKMDEPSGIRLVTVEALADDAGLSVDELADQLHVDLIRQLRDELDRMVKEYEGALGVVRSDLFMEIYYTG